MLVVAMTHSNTMEPSVPATNQPRTRDCHMTPDPVGRSDMSGPAMVDRSGGYRLRGWDRGGKSHDHSER